VRRPSRLWYVIPAVAVAAMIGLGIDGVTSLVRGFDEMQRVDMPGEAALTLPAGPAVFYYEVTGAVGGEIDVAARCALRDDQGGEADFEPYSGSATYSFGSRRGVAMFESDLARAGTYQLVCAPDSGPFVMAVAPGLLGPVLGFLALLAPLALIAVVSGGLVAYLRHRTPPAPPAPMGRFAA
jgi:hypothetical protein